MTVDIGFMTNLRDAQCAEEVTRLAALGWFDVEFTVYGTAWYSHKKRMYAISAEADKIYDLIEEKRANGECPSGIQMLTVKYPVPIGMQNFIGQEVKKELAIKMDQEFPADFFVELKNLEMAITCDSGDMYLKQLQNTLEGCFEEEALLKFELIVQHIYNCRKITDIHYREYLQWLANERKYMIDNVTPKNIYEKIFYGISYEENNILKYFSNARKEHVYRKKTELEMDGFTVSPVYGKVFYYDSKTRPMEIKRKFTNELKQYFSEEFMKKLREICSTNSKMNAEDFHKILLDFQKKYGNEAERTVLHYGCLWGII